MGRANLRKTLAPAIIDGSQVFHVRHLRLRALVTKEAPDEALIGSEDVQLLELILESHTRERADGGLSDTHRAQHDAQRFLGRPEAVLGGEPERGDAGGVVAVEVVEHAIGQLIEVPDQGQGVEKRLLLGAGGVPPVVFEVGDRDRKLFGQGSDPFLVRIREPG